MEGFATCKIVIVLDIGVYTCRLRGDPTWKDLLLAK